MAVGVGMTPSLIRLANRGLLSLAQILGRDISVSNTRTGARKSVDSSTATEVAANTVDQFNSGGVPVISSMYEAINLIDQDATTWTKVEIGGTVTVSDVGGGEYDITFNGTTDFGLALDAIWSPDAEAYTSTMEIKKVSGDTTPLGLYLKDGAGTNLDSDTLASLTTSYRRVVLSGTVVNTSSARVRLAVDSGQPFNCTVRVRLSRVVQSAASAAAFPDGSGSGASYGSDLVSFTMPTISTGYAVIRYIPYSTTSPTDPTLLETTGLTLSISGAGSIETDSGATSTITDDGTARVIIVTWDGVNHTISVDDETPVSVASALTPSGTSYNGNTSDGSQPSHAAQVIAFESGTISAAERTEWNTIMSAIGVTFR